MAGVEIADSIYWVGAVDWDVRTFHGHTYHTHRGTTYNAYLIVDDKIALVDTVMPGFEEEMMGRIAEIVDPAKIDYLIANHGELDHSGAIPYVLSRAPKATLVHSKRGAESIGKYHPDGSPKKVVVTGDTLSLGSKTLSFLEAPMLHWPDSMFTYVPQEKVLLPNDAFGQHLASCYRFADEVDAHVLWEEATQYFANILIPFSKLILRKVEEVQKLGLAIDVIAPSHGMIWRKDPLQIIAQYVKWAQGEAKPRVIVVYETMWGSTAQMARAIVDGISQAGVEARLYGVPQTDHTTIIGDLLESKGVLLGSATHNRRPLLNISAILEDLKGLQPVSKIGAAFGSSGWGGGATKILDGGLRESGIDVILDPLEVRWRANPDEIRKCVAFGRSFGERIHAALAG
jgi:flavorubredoxin